MEELDFVDDMFGEEELSPEEEQRLLEEQRAIRKAHLVGMYILVADNPDGKGVEYMFDRDLSKDTFWTQELADAKGFFSKETATKELKRYKRGNPRVGLVNEDYSVTEFPNENAKSCKKSKENK